MAVGDGVAVAVGTVVAVAVGAGAAVGDRVGTSVGCGAGETIATGIAVESARGVGPCSVGSIVGVGGEVGLEQAAKTANSAAVAAEMAFRLRKNGAITAMLPNCRPCSKYGMRTRQYRDLIQTG